jgi:hypothetical protein
VTCPWMNVISMKLATTSAARLACKIIALKYGLAPLHIFITFLH